MKMSLCNTFRLFVVSLIIVLSCIDTPVVSFTLRRTTLRGNYNRDLSQEESIVQEVKTDLGRKTNLEPVFNNTWNATENGENVTQTILQLQSLNIHTTENSKRTESEYTKILYSNRSPENTSVQNEKIENTSPNSKSKELQTTTIRVTLGPEILTQTTFDFNDTNVEINGSTEFKVIDITTLSNINIDSTNTVETTESYSFTENTNLNISKVNKSNTVAPINENKSINKGKQFRKTVKLSSTRRTPDKIKQRIMRLEDPETTTSYKLRTLPKWKKYTTIDRKRTSFVSDEKLKNSPKKEKMINAETKESRFSLQDTVTSDIPSLEQLKNDLLLSTFKHQTLERKSDMISNPLTIENITSAEQPAKLITTTPITATTTKWDIIESQRAGFLNLSGKTIFTEATSESETSGFKANAKQLLRTMFETESPDADILEDKPRNKVDSQSVLNEDALKEELLKEELINDHAENVQRQRDDGNNNKDFLTETSTTNSENYIQPNSSLDHNLSVKPIAVDKAKNITLYVVNPNYKPMKKIEVLPPRLFVRDPDDNSWRNESLSSLGIVFKPKNSTKPFTQVLKNKTEAEWNNLTEKDIKNDIPDLRERLQKMAEKRKSKRKKLDSFGNIVYFDYEESSNSAENTSIATDEYHINTTTLPELVTTEKLSSTSSELPQEVTSTIISTTSYTTSTPHSTKKSKKIFNVPEYYDSTDEEDIEYLNMAKIDLKKFTTSQKTTTPLHISTIAATPSEWPSRSSKLSHKFSPERKATIQHFPPLTTQKVNINDYDNAFKYRVESYTTETGTPQNTLPASVDVSSTPMNVNTPEYNNPQKDVVNNFKYTHKPDFTKALILTQPVLTTEPAFTLVHNDGNFDRDSLIIKNYKDFLNEAAKETEFSRNIDYIPFTEAPVQGVTKNAIIGEIETEKAKISIDDAYDYESQFRKDVLQRFVDNFNQNSERYKSGFPILFNNSIIHRGIQNGRDSASSRAIMRGLYNSDIFKPKIITQKKPCEPNCENVTVELSPAYELHYYVPEQEEREEAAAQPVTLPYQYRL